MNAWTSVLVACTDKERTTDLSWRSWFLAGSTDRGDMRFEGQLAVDNDTEIASRV